MSDVMFNGILWASFTFFMGGLFLSAGCLVMMLTYQDGFKHGSVNGLVRGSREGYEQGKRDAQPLRAKTGRFMARRA